MAPISRRLETQAARATSARAAETKPAFAPEWPILGLAFGLGAFFAWYVYHLDLIEILVDQNAHLNIARQIFDSLTPGVTQLGYWPPLVHVAIAPFAAIRPLFDTGLAGAFALIPFLALGAFFLYRLVRLFSGDRFTAAMAALLFAVNPYVLYYSVTPMMETLFIAMVFGTAYFLALWLERGSIRHLVMTGIFVALAGLARFEGMILLPLVAAVISVKLWTQRRSRSEIEAAVLLFLFLAILGALSIVAYSWFFGNDFMAFMHSPWSAYNQQRDYTRPTEHNFISSAQYIVHAAYYMIGKPQLIAAAAAFVALLLFFPSFNWAAVALVLLSPFIFDLFALWQGYIILYVKELPPFYFFNERYGLYGIGFAIAVPFMFLGLVAQKSSGDAGRFLARLFVAIVSVFLAAAGITMTYRVAFAERFSVVRESAARYPAWSQWEIARSLEQNYDFGKIFITRAVHDFVTAHSAIPLDNFVVESNYPYYDQVMGEPWLFTRWVVMYNSSNDANVLLPSWNRQNERISLAWGTSPVFQQYYSLVHENPYEQLYRVNEPAVRRYARLRKFDPRAIPSLNPDIVSWNPDTVYRDMAQGLGSENFVLSRSVPAPAKPASAITARTGAGRGMRPALEFVRADLGAAHATTSGFLRAAVRTAGAFLAAAGKYF